MQIELRGDGFFTIPVGRAMIAKRMAHHNFYPRQNKTSFLEAGLLVFFNPAAL